MSQKSVNAIKVLGVDAINKAKSGHPGVVMGAAPMAYSLFANHLRVNPKKENSLQKKLISLYKFSLKYSNSGSVIKEISQIRFFNFNSMYSLLTS